MTQPDSKRRCLSLFRQLWQGTRDWVAYTQQKLLHHSSGGSPQTALEWSQNLEVLKRGLIWALLGVSCLCVGTQSKDHRLRAEPPSEGERELLSLLSPGFWTGARSCIVRLLGKPVLGILSGVLVLKGDVILWYFLFLNHSMKWSHTAILSLLCV